MDNQYLNYWWKYGLCICTDLGKTYYYY